VKAKRSNNPTQRTPFGLSQRRIRELAEGTKTAQRELAELRQALREQGENLNALATVVERLLSRETDLPTMLLKEYNQLLRRDDQIQSTIYDLQVALTVARQQNAPDVHDAAHAGDEDLAQSKGIVGYRQHIRRIQEVVRGALPRNATVIVVSKGDDELLRLDGRRAWHFPQTEHGQYAGHYPSDSAEAIAHLEELRTKGAEFLLFPETALWWLEHYEEFNQHLENRYGRALWDDEHCIIHRLSADQDGSDYHPQKRKRRGAICCQRRGSQHRGGR
jgi:hypothetical protein